MPNFDPGYDDDPCGCQWVCFCHLKDKDGNIVFPEQKPETEEEERARKARQREEKLRLFQKYKHLYPADFRP